MRRAVFVLMLLAAACGGSDRRTLPPGQYAGSTADDRPFTVTIANPPRINDGKAEWLGRGDLRARNKAHSPELRCHTQADGEELRCVVRQPGQAEQSIELLRQ